MRNFTINIFLVFVLMACDTVSATQQTIESNQEQVIASNDVIDRTVVPEPGPAPQINLPEHKSITLDNGLRVFIIEDNKLPKVSISFQSEVAPLYEGDKAGLSQIVGDLMGRSTTNRTKFQIDDEIDFIGASFYTNDKSIYGESLTKHLPKLMDVFADVIHNPSFDTTELKKLKAQYISNNKAQSEDPNVIVSNVRRKVIYGENHPFGEIMTEESINAIGQKDCISYFERTFSPYQSYLSIVGDISFEEAKKLAEDYFGKMETRKKVTAVELPENNIKKTKIAFVDRPTSVQSSIQLAYAIDYNLSYGDYLAAKLVDEILGGTFTSRLNRNLREDKGFTYGIGSKLAENLYVGNFRVATSVRNAITDSAVYEILYELRNIVDEGINEQELSAAKSSLIGNFARSLEDAQTAGNFAINAAIYNLPEDYYSTYLQRLNATTLDDVNKAAKKYIKPENAYIVVVGKASEVADKLKRFGTIEYYNLKGERIDPPVDSTANDVLDISADDVYERYFEALGGKGKLKELRTYIMEGETRINDENAKIVVYHKSPNLRRMEVVMDGETIMTEVCDGEDIMTHYMGNTNILGDKENSMKIISAYTFPEMYYSELNVKSELNSIKTINGKECYEVIAYYPNNEQVVNYFEVESGLKRREERTSIKEMQILIEIDNFDEYQIVEGYKIPKTIISEEGTSGLEISILKVEINPILPADIFRIIK